MAERILDWEVIEKLVMVADEKGIETEELHKFLTMNKYMGKEIDAEFLAEFDMVRLFPEFMKFNEVQEFIVTYGLKQKLSDHNNTEKNLADRAKSVLDKFQDFVDGKVAGVRANGTSAKADKKLVGSLKAVCSVVSMDGLQAKKLFFPDTFTEADQKKLDEFNNLALEHLLKQRAKAAK